MHLEHLMTVDWDEPLVPRARGDRAAAAPATASGTCEHVAALAYAVAQEIDRDPSLLLRWRGCGAAETEAEVEPEAAPLELGDDPWLAGTLPPARPLRPLPVGAVLKRLGPSGVRVGGNDLADVLLPAYAAFEGDR